MYGRMCGARVRSKWQGPHLSKLYEIVDTGASLCLQKEIKYKILIRTMAKVAVISDTVVVSATSLGVGVWQDETNLSSKDTGGGVVDIIIRSSSSSSSRVDPASQKITSTSSKTFDSSTSSLTTDAAANSSNNSAPSNFKQKKRVRPISPENTKDTRVSSSRAAPNKSSSSVEIGDEAPDFEVCYY